MYTRKFQTVETETFVCCECSQRCPKPYPSDENYGTNLCDYCFEAALEAWEERRREIIAERNEY